MNARLGRFLVVEDDPGTATQPVRGLTRAGYEAGTAVIVVTARGGESDRVLAPDEGPSS